jgi:peptidoglycan/LPS O-acetylase OafA/YrhL
LYDSVAARWRWRIFGVRLSFLDSIRGGAALIVVTAHLHYAARPETWFLEAPGLRIFNQSVFAVAIFFALSGLVLFLQVEGQKISYPRFVVRRFFRIFPACIFAVTASYLTYLLWAPAPSATRGDWFNDVSWPPGISLTTYIHHLLLDGPDALLRPLWSLIIEWRVSLFFPALVMLFLWSPRLLAIVAGLTAIAIAAAPKALIVDGLFGIAGTYFYTVFFSAFFVAGMFIAAYRLSLVLFFRRWRFARYSLLALCVCFLCLRSNADDVFGYMRMGMVGCALIIFCMSDSKARRLLRTGGLRYIGRISYSLYLVHILWIGIFFRVLEGIDPLIIGGAVIAASIASADVMNRFIEKPFNKLGRYIVSLAWLPHPFFQIWKNRAPNDDVGRVLADRAFASRSNSDQK